MFKIDKNVPLPNGRAAYGSKYPFREMKVGDSFLIPGIKSVEAGSLLASARRMVPGAKFVTRTTDKGLRVWRSQ